MTRKSKKTATKKRVRVKLAPRVTTAVSVRLPAHVHLFLTNAASRTSFSVETLMVALVAVQVQAIFEKAGE